MRFPGLSSQFFLWKRWESGHGLQEGTAGGREAEAQAIDLWKREAEVEAAEGLAQRRALVERRQDPLRQRIAGLAGVRQPHGLVVVATVGPAKEDLLLGPHAREAPREELLAELSLRLAPPRAVAPLQVEPEHRRALGEQQVGHLPPLGVGERGVEPRQPAQRGGVALGGRPRPARA